tara:strand:- start:444 stop:590 length:147 start_codon:yes stop_codon:yes gene_type:complete
MDNKTIIKELLDLLEYIKDNLDHQCCQTLMDADSISAKIEEKIQELNL